MVVAVTLGVTLVACGSATTGPATTSTGGLSRAPTQVLKGSSFLTAYPADWTVTVKPLTPGATGAHGTTTYTLSSTGAELDEEGVPPTGTIGITIYETPLSTIEREDKDPNAKTQGAAALANYVVGTPDGAQGEIETVKLHQAADLGGVEAAGRSFEYTYSGNKNIQVDVVSQRNHQLALQVESDVEPALASQAQAALETITRNWRWR